MNAAVSQMTTAQATVESLRLNGIDTLFCVPGVQNDHLFDALYEQRNAIRPIHARHEQGAAYMALGAAMASGKPAAYCVVPGPGLLNTTAALSTAYACSAPVLALTGQIPTNSIGRGFGILHEIPDQLGVLRSLTKWSERIRTPAEGASLVGRAFAHLRSGRPRPVGLECPIDVWPRRGVVDLKQARVSLPTPPMDHGAIEKCVDLMRQARRPLIVVGWGAQHASAQVRQLAERLHAPVVAHRMGHGVLDGRHPLSVNIVAAHRLWKDADLVIGIGTRLQMQQAIWGMHPSRRVIRIDADPEELDRLRTPDAGVVGDAAAVLDVLLAELPLESSNEARAAQIAQVKADAASRLEVLRPQMDFLNSIRRELPEEGIFVDELTQIGYVSRLALPVYRPRTFLSPGYQGTLGWSVATAIGAKVAKPHVPVIAISGDGGFMFNVQELATAVLHDIAIVVVVFNDGAYGNVRRTQAQDFQGRFIATELRNPDFVALAESFGALGLRVHSAEQLRQALREALAADRPAVIEVPVQDMPDPWPFLKLGPTGPPSE